MCLLFIVPKVGSRYGQEGRTDYLQTRTGAEHAAPINRVNVQEIKQ